MATDKMYDLAFSYKKTKLWKQIFDSELFAVRLSDGEIGYCCVMGMAGEHLSLALYVGDEGYQSYQELARRTMSDMPTIDDIMDFSWMFRQVCLQCSFENKDDLEYAQVEEVRRYAKAHKIQLRGSYAFPKFFKYTRYRMPWTLQTQEEEQRICEALRAAIEVSRLLQTSTKIDIGLYPYDEDTDSFPLLIPTGNGYELSRTPVPPEWHETFPVPEPLDDIVVTELKKLKKKGVYACEILRLPGMLDDEDEDEDENELYPIFEDDEVDEEEEEPPYFPAILLCADVKSEEPIQVNPVPDYDTHPESLRDAFLETLFENKQLPRAIQVRNEQTRLLLEDLCMKSNILLSVNENIPVLDKMRMSGLFDDEDDGDDEDGENTEEMFEMMSDAFEEMSQMSDKELLLLPKDVVQQILEMSFFGIVPQELALRLRKLFRKM